MKLSGVLGKRLGLAALVSAATSAAFVVWVAPGSAPAQQLAGANGNGFDLKQAGASLPPPPPQGAYGEVIMVNPKWIVVQNHKGLQFPIRLDSVGNFLVRWPIRAADLTRNSMAEAIGQDGNSNNVITDHVDIFEGSNQDLVTPGYQRLGPNNLLFTTISAGYNRFMNGAAPAADDLQGGWAYPSPAGMTAIPAGMKVVGNVVSADPLQVGVFGSNAITVQPTGAGGVTMTEVTRGDPIYADKGDLVFLMPTELTSKTVALSQLVLYKKMPRAAFRRQR